jgi:uncharacterized protein (DUF1330 family)
MSAYLVCLVKVKDPETYKKYTARTPELIRKCGGRFLVRGGPVEVIEGTPFEDRLVVLEFPSVEVAKTFHASPEYREVMQHRLAASEATFLLAEGVPEGVAAPDDKVEASGPG